MKVGVIGAGRIGDGIARQLAAAGHDVLVAGRTCVVWGLIEDAGFLGVDLGGTADAAVMESPRRPGAVYGEEYRAQDAQAVVDALRDGRAIPPTPVYGT